MRVETLKDLLEWTKASHQHLSECMGHCSEHHDSERAALLLRYLSDHEKVLTEVIQSVIDTSTESMLTTWCLEYLNRQTINIHDACDERFASMDLSDIIEAVVNQHNQIIDLYAHLYSRAEIPSIQELFKQLTELEEHHIMQLVQGANRLDDV